MRPGEADGHGERIGTDVSVAGCPLGNFLGDNPTMDVRRDAERILRAATHVLNDVENVETEIVSAGNVAEVLIDRADGYDVTMLGAPTKELLLQFVLSTIPDLVKQRSESAVPVTKQNTAKTSAYYRWIVGDRTG